MKILFRCIVLLMASMMPGHAKYAEKCTAELAKAEYYQRGWNMLSYLNEDLATRKITSLYEEAFREELANQPAVVDKDDFKVKFCHTEIEELTRIHGQTTQAKELITISKSNECLKILKTFCKGLKGKPQDEWVVLDEDGSEITPTIAHAIPNAAPNPAPHDVHSNDASQELRGSIDGLLKELIDRKVYQVEIMDPTTGTLWWLTPRALELQSPESGWKMHVGLGLRHPARTISTVLSLLREHNVYHKVIGSENALGIMETNLTQHGKVIAIYPRNEKEMIEITKILDHALVPLGERYIIPRFEAKIGRSGALTARYGVLRAGKYDGQHILVTDRNGKPVLKEDKNGKPREQTVKDSRDGREWEKTYAPDFVNWNPFAEAGIEFLAPPEEGWSANHAELPSQPEGERK
jgi:hypothetical protein